MYASHIPHTHTHIHTHTHTHTYITHTHAYKHPTKVVLKNQACKTGIPGLKWQMVIVIVQE